MPLGPPNQDVGVEDLCVGVEVDVALLLDPGQRLPGRPLEQDIPVGDEDYNDGCDDCEGVDDDVNDVNHLLLVLVEPLLLVGPVLKHPVLLGQQLLQDY